MKKIVISCIVAFFSFFALSATAKADLISYSLGMPVTFAFTKKADNGFDMESKGYPKGQLIHIQLPIFTGFGYERYEQDITFNEAFFKKASDYEEHQEDFKLRFTSYDMFFTLPIPIIKLSVGVGAVKAELVSSSIDFDPYLNNWAWQQYIQVGLPVLVIFDLHVSYHQIFGKLKVKDEEKYNMLSEVPIDSEVYAIGASVGF